MKILDVFFLILIVFFASIGFADVQNEVITQDAVGTIGYCDDLYFTVVLKTDFSPIGDDEIGFMKTDDLQLPPMQRWSDITPGLEVRVTYEEVSASERAKVKGVESQRAAVLERKAVKLVIGQEKPRRALAS